MPEIGGFTAQGEGTVTFTLSPQAYQLLTELARESGESGDSLIRKALGLMKVAVEAHKAGKRLGIAGEGQALDTEIEVF